MPNKKPTPVCGRCGGIMERLETGWYQWIERGWQLCDRASYFCEGLRGSDDRVAAGSVVAPAVEVVMTKRRCGYQLCNKPAVRRVRWHHDGYENDKHGWFCEAHAKQVET